MPEGKDADAEPNAGYGTEHIIDTYAGVEATPPAGSPLTPWPFPMADSMNGEQSRPLAT